MEPSRTGWLLARREVWSAPEPTHAGSRFMHAVDIAEPCMTVTADQDVLPALRQLLDGPADCLVVVDEVGEPYHLVQGHELVRMLLPGFVVAHPGPAALYGLAPPAELLATLDGRRFSECLPPVRRTPPTVHTSASLAQTMLCLAGGHSPYTVVVMREGRRTEVRGIVTARGLLVYLAGAAKAERLLDDAAS